jgi:hypothetical protein
MKMTPLDDTTVQFLDALDELQRRSSEDSSTGWSDSLREDTVGPSDWKTDTANQRGGEWMGADKNSSPTHYPSWPSPRSHGSATGPRNQHTHPSDPRTQRNTKPRVHWPTPVRPVSTTGHTGPCWWNWSTFTKWLHTGRTGETHRSDRSQPESPQSTKQANRPPNCPKLETDATQDNSEHSQTFTRAKTHRGLHRSDRSRAPVRPV